MILVEGLQNTDMEIMILLLYYDLNFILIVVSIFRMLGTRFLVITYYTFGMC